MITYNWDLGIKIVIGYVMAMATANILLGISGAEKNKDNKYGVGELMLGIFMLLFLSLPIFF